jgi:hypothetical protein
LTQGKTPWNPSPYSDQVADKFYQQVIEAESHNVINKDTHINLSFFDPSDFNSNHQSAKPAHLIFDAETIQEYMVNDIVPTSTDLHLSMALPSKLDFEKPHILHSDHMMSFSIHYGKPHSWLNLPFIILCNVISKVSFKC